MTSVSQFAQYLLKLDPQRNPARQTLFHFLKHMMDADVPFSPAVMQTFYARVLQFDHWQNQPEQLSETIRADLDNFLRHYPDVKNAFPWGELRHSDTLQIIPIKVYQDMADLVLSEHEARQKSGDQISLIQLSPQQIMVLVLAPSGALEVKVYPLMALVTGPKLKLVAPVSRLLYTPELELMPHTRQILEGNLLTIHCFQIDHEGAQGLVTRGHSLQKFETYIRARLSDTHDLFTSLKRLERHYINPQSDPDYQEIVAKLERANRMLEHPTAENLMMAEKALNRGRSSLKSAFPNDRLLSLLVTHLEYGISQRRTHEQRPTQ